MLCPECKTENRDDRAACYHCGADLAALCVLVNRAKNLYNDALEHAERGRPEQAIANLLGALELDASFVNAWVVLGTIHARERRLDQAREAWEKALALDPRFEKCHEYLEKLPAVREGLPSVERMKGALACLSAATVALSCAVVWLALPAAPARKIQETAGDGGIGPLTLLALPIVLALAFRALTSLPRISGRVSGVLKGKG